MIQFAKQSLYLSRPLLPFRSQFGFGMRQKFRDSLIKRSQQEMKRRQEGMGQEQKQRIKKAEESMTEEERQMIKTYTVDPVWNLLLRQSPDHNFQKDIIIHKKTFQKSTKELRSAILFQDLLKTEIDIMIYETKGRPFAHALLKLFYAMLSIGAVVWSFYAIREYDPKNGVLLDRTTQGKIVKYSLYLVIGVMFVLAWSRYFKFMQRYVERIVYNTEKEEFTFVKRSYWGFKRQYVSSRYKILYTQNPFLNKLGTNYFHIDTKQEFSVAFKECWVKQDLFSHLISQRIKL